jgi:hypothetical protein
MHRDKKQKIAVVCAVFATALIFVIGQWYWYRAELVGMQQASDQRGIDRDGSLDVSLDK